MSYPYTILEEKPKAVHVRCFLCGRTMWIPTHKADRVMDRHLLQDAIMARKHRYSVLSAARKKTITPLSRRDLPLKGAPHDPTCIQSDSTEKKRRSRASTSA